MLQVRTRGYPGDVSVIHGLLDRGDLLERLDRATSKRVTVISAPAGSGKTSLLRAWADRAAGGRRGALLAGGGGRHRAGRVWGSGLGAVPGPPGAGEARTP